MENFYTAYSKVIQNTTFYFVKKFVTFPEFKDMPPVLESYGMHADFQRACEIAQINDKEVRNNLLMNLQNTANSAKIIHMNMTKGKTAEQ